MFEIGIACLIAFLAFLIRGFGGFGAGLILAPLLAFWFDLREIVVISIVLQLIVDAYLTYQTRPTFDGQTLWILVIPACISSVAGAYALSALHSDLLLTVLGVTTTINAIRMLASPLATHLAGNQQPIYLSILVAAASGLFHGLFGTGGPPIVLFLSNRMADRAALRAALLIYFLALDSVLAITYLTISLASGDSPLIGPHMARLGGVLLVPAIAGAAAGDYLQQRFSEVAFRRAVAIVLIVAGCLIIQKGVTAH